MSPRKPSGKMSAVTIKTTPQGRFEWERALREQSGISLPVRGVLMTLATYATTTTGADIRPSIQRLATTMGLSRSNLNSHIKTAQELGWIRKVKANARSGRPSHYILTVPTQDRAATPDTGDPQAGQGRPVKSPPLSGSEDRTATVTNQGPPQEVPSVWDEVERMFDEMRHAPPFD